MNQDEAPSIYDSFNARYLDYAQVAASFIPPPQYAQLIRRNHAVLIGPRGAGKTTLLKMLHGQALAAWQHDEADSYRRQVDFTGIFVPTDRAWSEQVEHISIGLEPEFRVLFSISAFTAHILRALAEAMQYRIVRPSDSRERPYRAVELSEEAEEDLVRDIASSWHFRQPVVDFESLISLLERRLNDLGELASSEVFRDSTDRGERLAKERILHMQHQTHAIHAISRFNAAVGEKAGKWAFLFDELELIPNTLRGVLFRSLRSTDQRLLFKLSLAPWTEGVGALEGDSLVMPGHDYAPIVLTYPQKEKAYAFCRQLLDGMLQQWELPVVTSEKVLGRSVFDAPSHGPGASGYGPTSPQVRRLKKLRRVDASFDDYLRREGVDLDQLVFLKEEERAADVRKIISIAALRLAYRNPDDRIAKTGKVISNRRNARVYSGATSLFAMVEGNPRWFLGIVAQMLDDLKRRTRDHGVRVSDSEQAGVVSAASELFRALLKTIPAAAPEPGEEARGIIGILDRVGEYLRDEVIARDFNPDPPGTFRVDLGADPRLLEELQTALNAGAIVYVPAPGEGWLPRSLVGKRFRLAYLLAPYYRTSLTLGRPVTLSRMLQRSPDLAGVGEETPEQVADPDVDLQLFDRAPP